MTLEDWLAALTPSALSSTIFGLSNRKSHLLTVAFLRRVWNQLDSDHTRIAVDATEKFVDGRMMVDELARLRSADLLETCEPLWASWVPGSCDEELIGFGCACCQAGESQVAEYECRVARDGYILHGVKAGVERPDWIMTKAAFHARELVAWSADPDERDTAIRKEALAQFDLFQDVAPDEFLSDSEWSSWRTDTVQAMARVIYRERAFDLLPILADALQDAGCNDRRVLSHCREANNHVRGCWVVDRAIGIA